MPTISKKEIDFDFYALFTHISTNSIVILMNKKKTITVIQIYKRVNSLFSFVCAGTSVVGVVKVFGATSSEYLNFQMK